MGSACDECHLLVRRKNRNLHLQTSNRFEQIEVLRCLAGSDRNYSKVSWFITYLTGRIQPTYIGLYRGYHPFTKYHTMDIPVVYTWFAVVAQLFWASFLVVEPGTPSRICFLPPDKMLIFDVNMSLE